MGNNPSHVIVVVVYGYQHFGFQCVHPPYWSIFRFSQTLKLSDSPPKYLYLEGESSFLNTTQKFSTSQKQSGNWKISNSLYTAAIRPRYCNYTAILRPRYGHDATHQPLTLRNKPVSCISHLANTWLLTGTSKVVSSRLLNGL